MSFDLRIHFVGLAMYVPQGKEAMHVLLPSTAGHVHPEPEPQPEPEPSEPGRYVHPHGELDTGDQSVHADEEEPADTGTEDGHVHTDGGAPADAKVETKKVDEHFARIMFDKAYLEPGATQLSREYVMLDLQGRVLDLSGLDAGPLNDTLPDELAPMDRVANGVERVLVTELPDERLAGRITFNAGALTDYSLGARWRLNGGPEQRLTLDTEWTIRDIKSTNSEKGKAPFLPGRVLPSASDPADLAEDKKIRLPHLYPVADTIHLMVFHTVANQLPPAGDFDIGVPPATDRPDHFMAYYSICPKRDDVPPAGEKPVAAPARKVVVDGPTVPATGKEFPSLSCVQARASLA